MIITKKTHAEFHSGVNADVDTTAERLTDLSIPVYSKVRVQAATGNSDSVFVGHDSGVTASNGWELDAGEYVEIEIDDPSKIWVIGGAINQAVKWLAV